MYRISSSKGINGLPRLHPSLESAIQAALQVDDVLHPSFGVEVSDEDGETVATISDVIILENGNEIHPPGNGCSWSTVTKGGGGPTGSYSTLTEAIQAAS